MLAAAADISAWARGGADICVKHVSEIGVKCSSEVEIKLWLGEIELDRSLLLSFA